VKRFILSLASLLFVCNIAFGLTPKEREIVLHAKAQLESAQAEQKHSRDLAAWATQSNQQAWDFANATKAAADQTGKEINTAHQHEKEQASYIAQIEPVYKAVTRWWDIGAFVWGAKQLIKHLLILALFGTGLMLAFWGLTFAFPFLLPAFRIALIPFEWLIKHIEARMRK
jgi:hypothetical protein